MAGVESAVQLHIERGDDLNARDANGMTPLMLAAARDKPRICSLLLLAGADHGLLDRSGKTAFDIAITAGAQTAAAVLNGLRVQAPSLSVSSTERSPPTVASGVPEAIEDSPESEEPAALLAPEPSQMAASTAQPTDDGEFDLSAWEVEEETPRPEADLSVVDSASAVQIAITAHLPIDSSAVWDDVDAYLPPVALPLARVDDADGRARLRRLLLRAIREGSVPSLDVEDQSTNEDRSANPEAVACLTMVINDLGAEVDERCEYSDGNESFAVFVNQDETPDEEAAIDEALFAIDRAASPRHEPLRIYQREFQRLRLLTAEEEIRLAKDMEVALDTALDALATWPDGIARTLAAGAEAMAGSRQLSSIWVGGELDPGPVLTESLEAGVPALVDAEDVEDDDGELTYEVSPGACHANFSDAFHRLAKLVERADGTQHSAPEVRQALAGLHLNRRFLLELIDAAKGPAPCSRFLCAMAEFRRARDWMAAANLKLSFFQAKKYLHSGELLDDLAQEGNIGLLKAVDRYDWRRGFRFSTYATWWIRQQISRYVADKARTIRLPVHVHEKLQRAERVFQGFDAAVGHGPTLDEVAERVEMPRHKLAALLRIAPEPSVIDEATIDSMIAVEARDAFVSPDPADLVNEIQLNRAVDLYISSLSTKDRKEERVLRLRFGIGIGEALTLDEVGQRFGVTRERIRQIEAKAIRKLKDPVRSEPFSRLVLGLDLKDNPTADWAHESRSCDATEVPDAQRRSDEPRRNGDLQLQDKSIQPPDPPVPTELDRVIALAAALEVLVDDDRLNSGHIWVKLLEDRGTSHRLLAHRLIVLGFDFLPGKGYWK